MKKLAFIFSLLCLSFISCGGGDGDSNGGDGNGLSNNACSTLGLSTRIIQGTTCSDEDSPVVMIVLGNSDGSAALCTGTMISSTDVLTAAHCFVENPSTAYIMANGNQVNAVSFAVHPDVSYTNQAVFNDAAILRLETAVNLPTLPLVEGTQIQSGDVVQIFGYGVTEDQTDSNDTSGELRSGEMLVTSVSPDHITCNFNGDGSNTCFGDSGGPAILTLSSGQVGVVGITSSGALADCSSGDISLFANVQSDSILNFITQAVPSVGVI